jgi:hypothetical protein
MRDISPDPSAAFGKSGVRGCQLRMHLACARGETAYKIQLQRKILVRGTIKPVTGNDGDAIESVGPLRSEPGMVRAGMGLDLVITLELFTERREALDN